MYMYVGRFLFEPLKNWLVGIWTSMMCCAFTNICLNARVPELYQACIVSKVVPQDQVQE